MERTSNPLVQMDAISAVQSVLLEEMSNQARLAYIGTEGVYGIAVHREQYRLLSLALEAITNGD